MGNDFLEDVTLITKVLDENRRKFKMSVEGLSPKESIIKELIFKEISEIETIVRTIGLNMVKLSEIDFPDESNVNEYSFLIAQLKVWIKALYEWIAHLQELIKPTSKIKKMLSLTLLSQLETHCEFRHKLIAHKRKLEVMPFEGITHNAKQFKAEIIIGSFSLPKTAATEFEHLFARCVKHASGQINTEEKNFYKRCALLTHNLHLFSGNERRDVKSFIERYGATTLDVKKLVSFIRKLVSELIPKLANLS